MSSEEKSSKIQISDELEAINRFGVNIGVNKSE